MEAAAAARAAEKKKKRPVAEVDQYELKRLKRGNRVDSLGEVASRVEVEVTPTVRPMVILLGVPLVEVVGGSSPRLVRSEAKGSHLPEPAWDRIRLALLLGDI